MSKELYKRFRPKTLEKVIGNEATVTSLQKMVVGDKLPHCILFSGPSGCGKTSLARILAKTVLGCSPFDLVELNCSSFRGIDTIRDIQRVMDLSPVGGKCRVWIIDECHQLSKDAQNAALKIFEDTPDHVYFFLATTDPQKLLPTIRTRCTEMPVALLRDDDMSKIILRVCKKEGIDISSGTVDDICEAAKGSPRKALVILDKIRNLPEEKRAEAMKIESDEEKQAIDLCRALIKKESWQKIVGIARSIKTEPESVRWAILGYARSVMLASKDGKSCTQAYLVIRAFENNFFDSKEVGLVRACYEAIYG